MTRVPGDVIVVAQAGGRWLVHNVFAHTSLVVDTAALGVAAAPDDLAAFGDRRFEVWEVERFTNEDGLLADPTRFVREPEAWPEAEPLTAAELVDRLRRHLLLVDDESAYRARFAAKRDLYDGEHIGNFHQQLGEHLLLRRREDPGAWWVRQKFTEDMRGVRDNLYGAVQARFLERYFPEIVEAGDVVVDVGSGTGFYSCMIAAAGARVIGVDPSEAYVELAREHAAEAGHDATFTVAPVSQPGALDFIDDASADLVFMSDALLFYFVPAAPDQVADISVLLADVRRILKPGGRFVSMEPHAIFWLAPWLGDEDRPFTLLTEYLDKTLGVTPSISQLIEAYTSNGFAVTRMHELVPEAAHEQRAPREFHFGRQFPLWHVFELAPAP